MKVVKYNPFDAFQLLDQDMDKLMPSWDWIPSVTDNSPLDMYEEDGKVVAEVRLPNFKKEEIHISTDNNVLEIRAKHDEKEEKKGKRRYYLREGSSQFMRRVRLPDGVETTKANAIYKDGVLKVVLPKGQTRKVKEISVK